MRPLGWKAASLAGLLSFGIAASCSSSDEKRRVTRDDAGGEAGDAPAQAGAGGSVGGSDVGGSQVAPGGAPSLAGAAGERGVELGGAGAGGGAGTGEGGAAAGEGGANSSGASGAAGAGGADACCSAADYVAASSGQVIPSDVACSTWSLFDNAAPEQPGFAGNVLSIASSADAESMYFYHADANLTFPASFTFEARVRLVSGAGSTPSRGPVAMMFIYGAAHQKNLLQLSATEIFILTGENQKGAAYAMDTSVFHTYKLVVDTTLNTFDVFVDDVLRLSGATFVDPNNAPEIVAFGEASIYAYGSSEWAFVRHNAYVCN